jgi:ATP-binding protein involved in chromosome partitioning
MTEAGSKSLAVLDALRQVNLNGEDIVSLGAVKDLAIHDEVVRFVLVLPEGHSGSAAQVTKQAEEAISALEWVRDTAITLGQPADYEIRQAPAAAPQPQPQPPQNALPEVKHVIAVGSGKGGVGKSTVSVNLALALAAQGHAVGLLDADVYGPSVPLMLGAKGSPMITDDEKIIPLEAHGLKMMSMGLLLKPEQAVVWRGPMVHGVVQQFINDVEWGQLDYLIVDLPPGTGDASLSLVQALPLTAAVVVTTPQEVAAAVAQKAMNMFERMGVSILGVIENMSYFICPETEKTYYIFGEGGGKSLADGASLPFLGEIPIDMRMRQGGDQGEPVMVSHQNSNLAGQFLEVAKRLANSVGG